MTLGIRASFGVPMEGLVRPWVDVLQNGPRYALPPAAVEMIEAQVSWGGPANFNSFQASFAEQAKSPVVVHVTDLNQEGPPAVHDIVYTFTELAEKRRWHGELIQHPSDDPELFGTVPVIDYVEFEGPDFTGELAAQRQKRESKWIDEDFGYSGLVQDPVSGDYRQPKVFYTFNTPSHFAHRSPDVHSPLSPWNTIAGGLPT